MATRILMPKLGLTMTEGTITEWVVSAGEKVSKGSTVMLIETDKVEAEVEAEVELATKLPLDQSPLSSTNDPAPTISVVEEYPENAKV